MRRRLHRALLAALLACAALFAAPAQARFERESPAWRELMATPLGADAAQGFQWSALLRRNGFRDEAAALQRVLAWRVLQQANGEAPAADLSVGAALALAAALPSPEALAALLDSALARHAVPRFLTASVPAPAAWGQAGPVLEMAPGLWLRPEPGSPQPMGLLLDLAWQGPVPLWVDALKLASGAVSWPFHCGSRERPLGLLTPGQVLRVECMGVALGDPADARTQALARAFRAGAAAPVNASLLRDPRGDGVGTLAFHLEKATLSGHRDAALFGERNAACERRGTCVERVATAAVALEAERPRSPRRGAAAAWLLLATVVWVYCGLALALGNARARRVGFVLGVVCALPATFMAGAGVASLVTHQSGAQYAFGAFSALVGAPFFALLVVWPLHALCHVLFESSGLVWRVFARPR